MTTYDLALYPAPGPGLGHLMRCLALAQWAVELNARVIVCLPILPEMPRMPWPCPVLVGRYCNEARVTINDGSVGPLQDDPHVPVWYMIDGKDSWVHSGNVVGAIYPHFGARPVPGFPTFVGPSWMPLRLPFQYEPVNEPRTFAPASYRAGERKGHVKLEGSAQDVRRTLSLATHAVVPASTVAYEALASGCPVRLLRDITPDCDRIGAAMVAAGVATWDDSSDALALPAKHRYGVDGLGAKRLLEALL